VRSGRHPARHDSKGRPDKFEARAYYRNFDGRRRQLAAWSKTKTGAANSLRTTSIERAGLGNTDGLKPTDRFSVGAELFMANLKALVDEGVRPPGTYDTYRHHLDKPSSHRGGSVL
jgi:hypothetical protein